jgi:hypothetical protein
VTSEASNLTRTFYLPIVSVGDSSLLVCDRGRKCVEFIFAVGVLSEIHARQLECHLTNFMH